MDKVKWKDFTKNMPEEDEDQPLLSRINRIKCTQEREQTLVFPNPLMSTSMRLQKQIRFQEKGKEVSRTVEIKEFLLVTTLKKFEN